MTNRAMVVGGLALAGAGIFLLTRKAKAAEKPDEGAVPETPEELEELLAQWAAYFDSLVDQYADDPTLADQLAQALNSMEATLSLGIPLNEDPSFVQFMQRLNGYMAYRETAYITFHEFLYGW